MLELLKKNKNKKRAKTRKAEQKFQEEEIGKGSNGLDGNAMFEKDHGLRGIDEDMRAPMFWYLIRKEIVFRQGWGCCVGGGGGRETSSSFQLKLQTQQQIKLSK